jgi:hypothetical protein
MDCTEVMDRLTRLQTRRCQTGTSRSQYVFEAHLSLIIFESFLILRQHLLHFQIYTYPALMDNTLIPEDYAIANCKNYSMLISNQFVSLLVTDDHQS